jgi:hypothetical protein
MSVQEMTGTLSATPTPTFEQKMKNPNLKTETLRNLLI